MIRTLHEFGRGGKQEAINVFEAILRENTEAKRIKRCNFYGLFELEDTFITFAI